MQQCQSVRRASSDTQFDAARNLMASASREPHFVPRPDPLYHAVLLGLSSVTIILAVLLSVREETQVVIPLIGVPIPELCMMRRTCGIECPGCGLTRCFISVAHGQLGDAWSYNPAGIWLFLIVAFQIPYRSLQLWRIKRGHREIACSLPAQVALGLLAIALVVQWAIRLAGVQF
jgi:Protein of unknown function (DUF2752)